MHSSEGSEKELFCISASSAAEVDIPKRHTAQKKEKKKIIRSECDCEHVRNVCANKEKIGEKNTRKAFK